MDFKIIYQDQNLLAVDKFSGISVYPGKKQESQTLITNLIKKFPFLKTVGSWPRYGIIHRLDKDASGIVLIAKNNQCLAFLQKQFKEGKRVLFKSVGDGTNGSIELTYGMVSIKSCRY